MPSSSGILITFEGGSAAGKSTQAALLGERLRASGYRVAHTREPGGTTGAEAIRDLVKSQHPLSPSVLKLLFLAARRDHVERVIAPALARGDIVLCERYLHSTLAYQVGVHPEEWRRCIEEHQRLTDGLFPDVALYIDVPPAVAAARRVHHREGADPADPFAAKRAMFYSEARMAYEIMADVHLANLWRVDGSGTALSTHANTLALLARRVPGLQIAPARDGSSAPAGIPIVTTTPSIPPDDAVAVPRQRPPRIAERVVLATG